MAIPAPEESLEEELRSCLENKGVRYIYKDLPRLALRTTVWVGEAKPSATDLASSGPIYSRGQEGLRSSRGGLSRSGTGILLRSADFGGEESDEDDENEELVLGGVTLRVSDFTSRDSITRNRGGAKGESEEREKEKEEEAKEEEEEEKEITLEQVFTSLRSSWSSEDQRKVLEVAEASFADALVLSVDDVLLLGEKDWQELTSEPKLRLAIIKEIEKLEARQQTLSHLNSLIDTAEGEAEEKQRAKVAFADALILETEDLLLLSDGDWEELGVMADLKQSLLAACLSEVSLSYTEEEKEQYEEKLIQEQELRVEEMMQQAEKEAAMKEKGRNRSRSQERAAVTHMDGTSIPFSRAQGKKRQLGAIRKMGKRKDLRQKAIMDVRALAAEDAQLAGYARLCEVERVVCSIAKVLETEEKYEEIVEEFEKVKVVENKDLEITLERLFEDTIGVDSKTTRLLKGIQQGVVMSSSYHVKYHVTKELMTRDMKGRDGWQIVINLSQANGVATVTHMRREQALASAGVENYFWFEWHVSMVLDLATLSTLHSSSLRIADLWTSATMSDDKTYELRTRFCAGKLRLC